MTKKVHPIHPFPKMWLWIKIWVPCSSHQKIDGSYFHVHPMFFFTGNGSNVIHSHVPRMPTVLIQNLHAPGVMGHTRGPPTQPMEDLFWDISKQKAMGCLSQKWLGFRSSSWNP